MNREILFRAKSELTNKWVYGALYENFIIFTGNFDKEHPNEYANVYGNKIFYETVGQFTGLTDKNGNKIFEGDIVKYTNNQKGIYEIGAKMKGVIVYSDYTLTFCSKNNFQMDNSSWMFADDLEVIGNIYENPELLK